MELPYKEFPDVSVTNGSEHFVVMGNLCRITRERIVFTEPIKLLPNETTKPNHISRDLNTGLAEFHSGTSRYLLDIRNGTLRLFMCLPPQKVTSDKEIRWEEPSILLQEIPLKKINALVAATIKKNGTVALVVPGYKPQDGRPNVSLAAYGELTRHECYCTPRFILGLSGHINAGIVKAAYNARQKELQKLKNSHECGLLLDWAYTKLIADLAICQP